VKDITQQALVSDAEIQQLLNTIASQHSNSMLNNRFASIGEHPSEVIGTGMDFADRQPYSRGDDTRFIDWRASARSNKTLIKRFHTELSTPCCVVIDRRASMLFGTKTRLKATQAIRAGIRCGAQFLKAGQQLACLVLDEKLYWQAPNSCLATFNTTAKHAARAAPPNHNTQPSDAMHWSQISDYLHTKLPQGSQLVLISDFISSTDKHDSNSKALRYLTQQFHCSLLSIRDAAEQQLSQYPVNLSIHQSLTLNINRSGNLKRVNQQLKAHQLALEEQFKKLDCRHQFIFTDDELTQLNVA